MVKPESAQTAHKTSTPSHCALHTRLHFATLHTAHFTSLHTARCTKLSRISTRTFQHSTFIESKDALLTLCCIALNDNQFHGCAKYIFPHCVILYFNVAQSTFFRTHCRSPPTPRISLFICLSLSDVFTPNNSHAECALYTQLIRERAR